MSFNLDDPLAGILSDGSDDSFFDDDILGKKKPAKKKSTPVAEKKNALFDLGTDKNSAIDEKKDSLFDLGGPKKSSAGDELKLAPKFDKPKTPSPEPFKRAVSKESIKTDSRRQSDRFDLGKSPAKSKLGGSTDILSALDETKKDTFKPIEKGKSSQSLLDDILGGPSTKSAAPQARPTTAAKKTEFDFDTILSGKSEPKKSATPNKPVAKPPVKPEPAKAEAPPKKKSSEDWLGIFGEKEADNEDEDDSGMPAWLGGGDSKKKKAEKEKKLPKPVEEEATRDEPEAAVIPTFKEPEFNITPNIEQLTKITNTNVLQGNEDVAAEGAALYFQQQEAQLMIALQLKAQEEKLATIQMRQKESQRVQQSAAAAAREQLDALLRRQALHRRQMHDVIAGHQDRITQRIKDLLGTPTVDVTDEQNEDVVLENSPDDVKETPHSKEKKQLLQLVQSLQENHDKEIDLMETSYRRQLAFLEVSFTQAEERMRDESEKLVRFYSEKINWLEEHHQLYKKMTEENLNSLIDRHKAENEMLRQQHLDNVKILQEHHATLMENIKNAVKQEQVLIKDSASFSSDLQDLLVDVRENKSQCQLLLNKVQTLAENSQNDTDRSLQARESQITEMIQQLKKERDNFETEKTESREIVKMLETRLKQMTTMIEEESAALKQRKMEFEFEKATFNKQTEFAKNVLKRQDEEMKILKEEIQKEYKDKISSIDDEKAKAVKDSAFIAKEKASVQNMKQELEKIKAELQAQLEEVTEERSKVNVEKQQVQMEEQKVLAKSRDLDLLAKAAIEKQSQADKKYSEAEFIQRKYEERIRRIQEHVVSLNAREKQIAKEKVALSRERLSLHNEKRQIEGHQQCSLCKSSRNIPQYNFEPSYALPDAYGPVSRDYGTANVNSAMNALESEMAHLMGRNFGIRPNAGVTPMNNDYSYEDRKEDVVNDHQAAQFDSGAFKDYVQDPRFMMLRLDVQQVISNLDQSKKDDVDKLEGVNE